jgi:predicted MFS family arabinose efflux permease
MKFNIYLFAITMELSLSCVSFGVPLYARSLGATDALIGVIGSGFGLSYIFSALISHRITGRRNPRNILGLLALLYAIISGVYVLVEKPAAFFFIRFVEGFTLGLFWPLADSIPSWFAERKPGYMRNYNAGWSTAVVVAPLLSGYLSMFYGLRSVFLLGLAFAFTEAVVVFLTMPVHLAVHETERPKSTGFGYVRPAFVNAYVTGTLLTLYPAWLNQTGFGYESIGILVGVMGFTRTVSFLLEHRIYQHLGERTMSTGYALCALFALVPFAKGFLLQLFVMAGVGVGMGLLFHEGLNLALEPAGKVLGNTSVFETALGTGFFFGPVVAGAVSVFGPFLIFPETAMVSLVQLVPIARRG